MGKKHEKIVQLLPWFVNDSLGSKEQTLVLSHLAGCTDCQKERDRLQSLETLIVDGSLALLDYRFSFRKLMARIEAAELNKESTADHGFGKKRSWLPGFGLAASVSIIAAIIALVPINSDQKEFQMLSTVTATPGVSHRFALTFAQPISAQTMRQTLIDTNSYLVSGPDSAGAYIVDIAVPDQMTDDEFIYSIKTIDGVEDAAFVAP